MVVGSLEIGVVEALETGETISGGILVFVVGIVVTGVLGRGVILSGGLFGGDVGTGVTLSGGILGDVVGMGRTEVLGTGVTDVPGGPCGRRCGGGVVEALSDIGVGSIGGAVVVGSLEIGVVGALETGETISGGILGGVVGTGVTLSGGILGGVVGTGVTEALGAEVTLFGGILGVEYGALEGVSGGVGGIGALEVSLEGGVGSIKGVVGFDGDGLVG